MGGFHCAPLGETYSSPAPRESATPIPVSPHLSIGTGRISSYPVRVVPHHH
jgi:hypothetical protein